MTGFIIIVFTFIMAFALLPILIAVCSSIDDYTAFKYDLAFLSYKYSFVYITIYF